VINERHNALSSRTYAVTESDTLYCYIHPNRPTVLRCNRCERPICTQDARRTPTGYRCPNCIREQQKVFDTAQWRDYVIAFVVAAGLSAVASVLVALVSSFFFGLGVLFLAPAAGGVIGNIVLSATSRRRSRALFATASGGIIAGALPAIIIISLPALLSALGGGFGGILALLPAVWQVVYLFLAVPAAYAQQSGIRLRR
jgi:hypothetical protein